jgi:hypothetical protein
LFGTQNLSIELSVASAAESYYPVTNTGTRERSIGDVVEHKKEFRPLEKENETLPVFIYIYSPVGNHSKLQNTGVNHYRIHASKSDGHRRAHANAGRD